MRMKIFGEVSDEICLRLIRGDRGERVELVVVDATGNVIPRGYLFAITDSGELIRYPDVDPSLGFKLDVHGRLSV